MVMSQSFWSRVLIFYIKDFKYMYFQMLFVLDVYINNQAE